MAFQRTAEDKLAAELAAELFGEELRIGVGIPRPLQLQNAQTILQMIASNHLIIGFLTGFEGDSVVIEYEASRRCGSLLSD